MFCGVSELKRLRFLKVVFKRTTSDSPAWLPNVALSGASELVKCTWLRSLHIDLDTYLRDGPGPSPVDRTNWIEQVISPMVLGKNHELEVLEAQLVVPDILPWCKSSPCLRELSIRVADDVSLYVWLAFARNDTMRSLNVDYPQSGTSNRESKAYKCGSWRVYQNARNLTLHKFSLG